MSAQRHCIFISYRRRETAFAVDQLDRALKHAFGDDAVFRDVRSIRKGLDFPGDIRAALAEARVGLVVIGPWWLTVSDPRDPASPCRLQDPTDWVRKEVEFLLCRELAPDQPIPCIPIFAGGADAPKAADLPNSLKPLATRDGMKFDAYPDTDHSIARIIEHLSKILGVIPRPLVPVNAPADEKPLRCGGNSFSVTGKKFVGREKELHLLDEAWGRVAGDKLNIFSLIGQGGEGKSAIVLKWLSRRARHGWQGTRRLFEWSFYSQGTSAQSSASADDFFIAAFAWFDPKCEMPKDSTTKGAKLAELIACERTLLVLDGLEPLQQPPGGFGGEFKDPAMKALLRGLAKNNPGLCILTSRTDITDLSTYEHADGSCLRHPLHSLDPTAARALLRELGVLGPDRELDEAAVWFHRHAYDLNLLGNYLAKCTTDQDIRGWQQRFPILKEDERIHPIPDAAGKRAGHGRRMLRAYERWLGADSPALVVLRLLGLFDRPVRSDLLDELRAAPVIPSLTDPLITLPDDEWLLALDQLQGLGLINREKLTLANETADVEKEMAAEQNTGKKAERSRRAVCYTLDTHPLLREHFGAELRANHEAARRAGHRRLYEYLRATTPDKPQPTLEDLQPLYQAVAHGCQAGLQQEACDKVFIERILRGKERDGYFSTRKLGAFSSDLGAVACFFEQHWCRVSSALSSADKAWLLTQAAIRLNALGRLSEALDPMRAGLEMAVTQKLWKDAAIGANNLSELELTMGKIEQAVTAGEKSATYADNSGDAMEKMRNRASHANALHQSGRRAEAEARFREAERMRFMVEPNYSLLFSLSGFHYCDLFLAVPERAAWQTILNLSLVTHQSSLTEFCGAVSQRIEQTSKWPDTIHRQSLLDIALNRLGSGRAALYAAILESCRSRPEQAQTSSAESKGPLTSSSITETASCELNAAVVGLRRASYLDFLPRGLLTRAWLRFLKGASIGHESAQEDLDEAWEIAERGPMKLFLADIHLHRARLFFREKEYPWNKNPDGSARGPKEDLDAAEKLINDCGYHRRDEELADAKRAILGNT